MSKPLLLLGSALTIFTAGCDGPCHFTENRLVFSGTSEIHAADGFMIAPSGAGVVTFLNNDWTLDPEAEPTFTMNAGVPNSGSFPAATTLGQLDVLNTLLAGKHLDQLKGDELAVGQTFADPLANISWITSDTSDGIFTPTLKYLVTAFGKAEVPRSSADAGSGASFLTLTFSGTGQGNTVQGTIALSLGEELDTNPCCHGGGGPECN